MRQGRSWGWDGIAQAQSWSRQQGEDLLDKFYKEAHVILSLNHEHLVTVYGVSTDADTPLLVMEYMANGSIPDYLSQNLRLVKR